METVIRIAIIYLVILVGLRLLGKRELSQLTPLELVTLMLIPEIVSQSTGPYVIGTLSYHWVGHDRPVVFTADLDDHRELMTQIYGTWKKKNGVFPLFDTTSFPY